MQSVICTLFEGHYHYGVASLINSLYDTGFRGDFYAGYRGDLPYWAGGAKENTQFNWPGSTKLEVAGADGIQVYFLPLDTKSHLTNHKPEFMLSLVNGPAAGSESIYYFDPDIIIVALWPLFKIWIDCGVALCEDINSPIPKYHPRRVAWRRYYSGHGITLNFKEATYANGGFVGLSSKDYGFLNVWHNLQELMGPVIGGLDKSSLTGLKISKEPENPFAPFSKTDQDALNATVEAWEGPVSFVSGEGMGWNQGYAMMPHAVGGEKPWEGKFLKGAVCGFKPRMVDKKYWNAVTSPIKLYSGSYLFWKKITINLAVFIGRFYAR